MVTCLLLEMKEGWKSAIIIPMEQFAMISGMNRLLELFALPSMVNELCFAIIYINIINSIIY